MRRAGAAAAALALASVAERRPTARAVGLLDLGPAGFEALAIELARHRLLPLLGARALVLAEDPPAPFTARVEEATTAARRVGELQGIVLERVMAMLGDADIASLPLKGVPLAERLHGDPALRASSDIDLLVSRERLPDAVRRLADAGFVPRDEWCDARGLPLLHRTLLAPGLPPVEVHWRIHWYEEAFAAGLLERSVPDARWGRRPDPVDEGLALLLFHARDGFGGLRVPADVAAWWDAEGARLERGVIAERVARHPALGPALTAAWDALEDAIGLPPRPWPAGRSLRVRLATRLADPELRTGADQIVAERSLVDGLLSPRAGLRRYARRTFVVPLDAMRERAERTGRTDGPARLRLAQAVVPLQVLPRFALAFPRRVWRRT